MEISAIKERTIRRKQKELKRKRKQEEKERLEKEEKAARLARRAEERKKEEEEVEDRRWTKFGFERESKWRDRITLPSKATRKAAIASFHRSPSPHTSSFDKMEPMPKRRRQEEFSIARMQSIPPQPPQFSATQDGSRLLEDLFRRHQEIEQQANALFASNFPSTSTHTAGTSQSRNWQEVSFLDVQMAEAPQNFVPPEYVNYQFAINNPPASETDTRAASTEVPERPQHGSEPREKQEKEVDKRVEKDDKREKHEKPKRGGTEDERRSQRRDGRRGSVERRDERGNRSNAYGYRDRYRFQHRSPHRRRETSPPQTRRNSRRVRSPREHRRPGRQDSRRHRYHSRTRAKEEVSMREARRRSHSRRRENPEGKSRVEQRSPIRKRHRSPSEKKSSDAKASCQSTRKGRRGRSSSSSTSSSSDSSSTGSSSSSSSGSSSDASSRSSSSKSSRRQLSKGKKESLQPKHSEFGSPTKKASSDGKESTGKEEKVSSKDVSLHSKMEH